jgi:hypothetical protein
MPFSCTTPSGSDLCFFTQQQQQQNTTTTCAPQHMTIPTTNTNFTLNKCFCAPGYRGDTFLFHYPNCVMLDSSFLTLLVVYTAYLIPILYVMGKDCKVATRLPLVLTYSGIISLVNVWAQTLSLYVQDGGYEGFWVLRSLNVATNLVWAYNLILITMRPVFATEFVSITWQIRFDRSLQGVCLLLFIIECSIGFTLAAISHDIELSLTYENLVPAFVFASYMANIIVVYTALVFALRLEWHIKQAIRAHTNASPNMNSPTNVATSSDSNDNNNNNIPSSSTKSKSSGNRKLELAHRRTVMIQKMAKTHIINATVIAAIISIHFALGSIPFLYVILIIQQFIFTTRVFGTSHRLARVESIKQPTVDKISQPQHPSGDDI